MNFADGSPVNTVTRSDSPSNLPSYSTSRAPLAVSEPNSPTNASSNLANAVNNTASRSKSPIVISSSPVNDQACFNSGDNPESIATAERINANVAIADYLQSEVDKFPPVYNARGRLINNLTLGDCKLYLTASKTTPEKCEMAHQVRKILMKEYGYFSDITSRRVTPTLIQYIRESTP